MTAQLGCPGCGCLGSHAASSALKQHFAPAVNPCAHFNLLLPGLPAFCSQASWCSAARNDFSAGFGRSLYEEEELKPQLPASLHFNPTSSRGKQPGMQDSPAEDMADKWPVR